MKILNRKFHYWRAVGHHRSICFPKRVRFVTLQENVLAVTIAFTHPACNRFHTLEKNLHYKLILNNGDFKINETQTLFSSPHRGMAMLFVRVLKNVLKVRYLILGGAIGGGMSLQKTYQQWLDALPDLSWIDRYLPEHADFNTVRETFLNMTEKLKQLEIDPRLRDVAGLNYQSVKDWFEARLEEAYLATEQEEMKGQRENEYSDSGGDKNSWSTNNSVKRAVTLSALSFGKSGTDSKEGQAAPTGGSKGDGGGGGGISEEDLWEIQMKYQKELERLERENKELRQQLMLQHAASHPLKKVKVSLIDMYSDVLDELSDYDTGYKSRDYLPRVVVIGDQSSGKTSVLEMIAQARIFPRGAGEMMTRSPVKVTLSEGPYHIAQFKDSLREFDLTKESDLAELRKEIELRMRNVVGSGKTVSRDVISLTVKGPGLQRMVLVDLPGIISTNTMGMAEDTKQAIYEIAKYYVSNPNAIILCIQDGSVDAERSNVTDLVSQMDPQGKRTIFVLTKVDLAEQNLSNPNRIKQILSGQLFPMKALGYFAVVTGRGTKNESIHQIKQYEEHFFRTSLLFNNKGIKSTQMTTKNLSLAVSECFWKMVRDSVEHQAETFRKQRFNLETEWKNKFPRVRIMDRNELFEKGRAEILDEVISLSEVPISQWEEILNVKLWDRIRDFIFDNVFFSTSQAGEFNTEVDIKLYQWAEQQLPYVSIAAGWDTLQEQFKNIIYNSSSQKEHDEIFHTLKTAVVHEVLHRHQWEGKAVDVLRVIQVNALSDQIITDKPQWDSAVRFLENCCKQKLQAIDKELDALLGPSFYERWYYWTYTTEEQKKRNEVRKELEKILINDPNHWSTLSEDELTTVRNTLERTDVKCDNEFIMESWKPMYKKHRLKNTLSKIPFYMKGFYLYKQHIEPQKYNEVILFWRIQQMLRVTVNSVRQQIVNREVQRLDEEIKDVLAAFGKDPNKKAALLTGRRVTLAEELKRVKQIQEKLEEFIQALNKEKTQLPRIGC